MASQPSTITSQLQSLDEELTTNHLAYLVETLHKVAPKSKSFGLQLGVDMDTLYKIEEDNRKRDDQFCEVLYTRLKRAPLTLRTIVQALAMKSVGENVLADEIITRFSLQSLVAASQQVTNVSMTTVASSTHHTVFQQPPQASMTIPSSQPHPPSRMDRNTPHALVGNMHSTSPQSLQYSSSTPCSNSPTSTPSQPQAEAAQPPMMK